MNEEEILDRLREAEQKLAVLTEKQQTDRDDINTLKGGISRGLWIIGGGFISTIIAWIAGGGLNR